MSNKISWVIIGLVCLVFVIWGLWLGIGGCARTTQEIETTTTTIAETKGWSYVGDPGFSNQSGSNVCLFLNNGTPFVAFNVGATALVMKYTGSSWEYIGDPVSGDTLGPLTGPTAFFVNNGTAYLAVREEQFGTYGGKVSVFKFSGVSWESVGERGFSAGTADYISLYVYNDTPYVAFQDHVNNYGTTVMKYNNSSWENVGAPGLSESTSDISLSVQNGVPYVAYIGKGATVMKYNGATWESVGEQNFTPLVDFLSFYIYNGIPYVAYSDVSTKDFGKCSAMKFNGTAWEYIGGQYFSPGSVSYVSMFIYNNIPYVAYMDWGFPSLGRATLMKFDGNNWNSIGSVGFSGIGHAVTYTSLFISNGIPHVAFSDVDNNGKISVMKYVE